MGKKDIIQIQENQPQVAVTPNTMLQTAIEQGADLEKLEKLMDLQERWMKEEARKAYIVAMSNFRANCPVIERTKKAHNSNYAGLAETIDEIKDLLAGCGLSHSWKTEQTEQLIKVTCCVTHVQGHQECTSLSETADTSGSKNKIQGLASTVSYLERYTLFAILGIASKEMDTDGSNRVSFEQAENLEKKATDAGVDLPKFLAYFRVGSFNAIPAKEYKNALAAIKAKADKK
jgi:hypothetical protein